MKKQSRFLQTPIEPFAVEAGLSADQILARMERISFQGRNLATAHRIWQKMLQDDVTIFMGMAGALSAGGLRLVVAHLILHRYVDCLVSTGANLYHDLHETRGQHHYVGSPHADDAALAEERIDRVYDTYASEEEFISNDNWIADFASTLEARPFTTREFLHLLGGHLWKTTNREGILTAAFRANVPIFCPAIADSSIGMGLSQARQKIPGTGHIDIIGDIVESANLVIRRPRTASVVLAAACARTSSTRRAWPSSTATRSAATATPCNRHRRAAFRRRVGFRASKRRKAGASSRPMPPECRFRPTRRLRCRSSPALSPPRRRRCSRSGPRRSSPWPTA
jgi:deoxyhypusine synthase